MKVRSLADTGRRWLLQFLDELANPNVRLSVAEWFTFIDRFAVTDVLSINAELPVNDTFSSSGNWTAGRSWTAAH